MRPPELETPVLSLLIFRSLLRLDTEESYVLPRLSLSLYFASFFIGPEEPELELTSLFPLSSLVLFRRTTSSRS